MSATTALLLSVIALAVAAALVLFHPFRRAGSQASSGAGRQPGGPIYRDDDRNWRGVFYYNPDDPELFVPKRYGLGWTINFGNPWGKVVAGIMIAMILLPIAVAIFAPGLHSYGCHPSGCHF